jgi:hypothetical protein
VGHFIYLLLFDNILLFINSFYAIIDIDTKLMAGDIAGAVGAVVAMQMIKKRK